MDKRQIDLVNIDMLLAFSNYVVDTVKGKELTKQKLHTPELVPHAHGTKEDNKKNTCW